MVALIELDVMTMNKLMAYFDYFYYRYYCMNIRREKLDHKWATIGALSVVFFMLFPQFAWIIVAYQYLISDEFQGPFYVILSLVIWFIISRYANKEKKYIDRFKSSPFNKISDFIIWIGILLAAYWGMGLLVICVKIMQANFEKGALLMWFKSILE